MGSGYYAYSRAVMRFAGGTTFEMLPVRIDEGGTKVRLLERGPTLGGAMITEPPKSAKVDWETLNAVQDLADSLRAKGALGEQAFLNLWAKAKAAAGDYPAALQSVRMLAPASLDPAKL